MNLIVFSDGTWNTPDQLDEGMLAPTNVVKLRNAVLENSEQKVYYHPGVGTEGGKLNHYIGGGMGEGLDENIMSAYYWLARNFQPGDKIWLFGFSRGAYTVRSLGGMISRCGLLNASHADTSDNKAREAVEALFAVYRQPEKDAKPVLASSKMPFYGVSSGQPTKHSIPIHFIGVWDTVGSLGIPDDMALLNLLDNPEKHNFHDTTLSPIVSHARHAIAIDEMRQAFMPTLWTGVDDNPNVKQCWFAGVHADIGGGYAQCGLSDITLRWMMDEAEAEGLQLQPNIRHQLSSGTPGQLHDSVTGVFKMLHTRPRGIPLLQTGNSAVHPTVIDRQTQPSLLHSRYRRTWVASSNSPLVAEIFAREHWNQTGIWLEAGVSYQLTAKGIWKDSSIPCGPSGTDDGKFYPGEAAQVLASLSDKLEDAWRGLTKNKTTDFWLSRRIGDKPWFSLIGLVANSLQGAESIDSNPLHQVFMIGDGCVFTPEASGYLYAYANDAWQMYDNNRGSVTLTVVRQ